MSENYDSVDVFVGVDVGKGEHHAVAYDRAGKVLFDKALPNNESTLREVIGNLKKHGQVLFVLDQPATIGALPVTVAQAESVLVGYLPGLAMRRIADLHPGEAKTDARDAAIIAQATRTLPTRCGPFNWPMNRSRNCRCCAGLTTPSWDKLSPPATASAGSSPRLSQR